MVRLERAMHGVIIDCGIDSKRVRGGAACHCFSLLLRSTLTSADEPVVKNAKGCEHKASICLS